MQESQPKRRGLKRMIAGFVICLLGTPLVVILSMLPVIQASRTVETVQMLAPGEQEFSLEKVKKPMKYYLWNEYEGSFEGKLYRSSEELPSGLQFQVFDAQGKELEVIFDSSTTSESSAGVSKKSIAFVRVTGPLEGRIVVQAQEEQDVEPRVIGFAPSPFRHIPMILLSVGLTVLTILLGGVLAIWGFVLWGVKSTKQV